MGNVFGCFSYVQKNVRNYFYNFRFWVFWRISTALSCLHERGGGQSIHQIGGCDCANQPLFTCDGGVHFWRSFAVFPVGGLGIPWRFLLLLHHFEHNWIWWHGSWRCHWRFYREDQKRMFFIWNYYHEMIDARFIIYFNVRIEILTIKFRIPNFLLGNIWNKKFWNCLERLWLLDLIQNY